MITMQSLQDKLLNLISKSNRHTGKNDTDVTEAINSLIAMKGTGGIGELTFSGNGRVQLLQNGKPVPLTGTNGHVVLKVGDQ